MVTSPWGGGHYPAWPMPPSHAWTVTTHAYGIPGGEHHGYCDVAQGCEVDHLISIELGGSNEKTNLWPQPYSGVQWNAHVKDRLENFYHEQVCSGKIPLRLHRGRLLMIGWPPTSKGSARGQVGGARGGPRACAVS